MADFDKVNQEIVEKVNPCGDECITGEVLQSTLLSINNVSKEASTESEARDASLQQGIDANKGNVTALTDKVAAVEMKVTDLSPRVGQNEADIAAIKDKEVAVDGEVAALKKEDARLDRRISDVANELPALKAKDEELADEVRKIALVDARQDSEIKQAQQGVDAVTPKVEALEGKVQKNEQDIASVKGKVAVTDNKVVAVENEQKAQANRITKNEKDIAALEGASNDYNISAINADPVGLVKQYTLKEAIVALNTHLGNVPKYRGIKVTFTDSADQIAKTYSYKGGEFTSVGSWNIISSGSDFPTMKADVQSLGCGLGKGGHDHSLSMDVESEFTICGYPLIIFGEGAPSAEHMTDERMKPLGGAPAFKGQIYIDVTAPSRGLYYAIGTESVSNWRN